MTNYIAAAAAALLLGLAADDASAADGGVRYVQANAGSSLAFVFTQADAANTGHFKTFATELQYDEANPTQGSLLVRVMIASLETHDEERDGILKDADMLDSKSHPAATYVARSFARNAAGGLEAVGKLTLRGVSRDLRLPLTLKPTANGLELSGQTVIRRLDYGVGQGDWKSTTSVGDEVRVEYKVALVRAAE